MQDVGRMFHLVRQLPVREMTGKEVVIADCVCKLCVCKNAVQWLLIAFYRQADLQVHYGQN